MSKRERYVAIGAFLGPAVALYAVFVVLPMAQAFHVALFQWRGLSMNREFVGLANFRKLLSDDPIFWQALGHNIVFLVASLVIVIPVALFFARTAAAGG